MRALAIAFLLAFPLPFAADAETNRLVLPAPADTTNAADVSLRGEGNILRIGQTAPAGTSDPNRILVSLSGERNGGLAPAGLEPAPLIEGLSWGSLTQSGEGNDMTIVVEGSGNLVAAAQTGMGNTLLASIAGTGNQAAVSQTGTGNTASFFQSGTGNSISITQRSW